MNKMRSVVFTHTDCGKHKGNEDVICVQEIDDFCSFYIVADGMGGYSHGVMAARLVVDEISQYIVRNIQNEDMPVLLQNAMTAANKVIALKSKELHCKMGATVSILLCKENTATIMWLGDVRVYRIRNNRLVQLTEDHNLAGYPHIVTRCVKGKVFEEKVPNIQIPILQRDRFIICSDGFYNVVNMEEFINYRLEDMLSLITDNDDDSSILEISFL